MRPSVIELRDFYATPRGRMAGRVLSQALCKLQAMTANAPPADLPLVAYGYAVPVLIGAPPRILQQALHLMPQEQGYQAWPPNLESAAASRTQLCTDAPWPLADAAAGMVLIMHALEHSADPFALLTEAWRVLAPQGHLWLVVPHRHSRWTSGPQAEATPCGRGQPYTARQLRDLLQATTFSLTTLHRALYTPPTAARPLLAAAPLLEALGSWLAPFIGGNAGGVLIVHAVKQVAAPIGLASAVKKPGLSLDFSNAVPTG